MADPSVSETILLPHRLRKKAVQRLALRPGDRETVLQKAWEALRPDGRLVIMNAGLPDSPLGRLLGPVGEAIATTFPGDPYSRPWEDINTRRSGLQSRVELGSSERRQLAGKAAGAR